MHIQDLIPIVDAALINALNRIMIKRVQCGEEGLNRGAFLDHQTKKCPKFHISCESSGIECLWTGPREYLSNHLNNCRRLKNQLNLIKILIQQLGGLLTQIKDKHNYLHST